MENITLLSQLQQHDTMAMMTTKTTMVMMVVMAMIILIGMTMKGVSKYLSTSQSYPARHAKQQAKSRAIKGVVPGVPH